MPTLNYTTKVAAAKTISEIQSMLVEHGAEAVVTNYENRQPVGLSFRLMTPHGIRDFSLPVDVEAAQRVLIAENREGFGASGRRNANWTTAEHAERVAWRVLKDWLAAQLAIIEWQMVAFDQVMLPYMHSGGELTVYDAYVAREESLRALTPGEP